MGDDDYDDFSKELNQYKKSKDRGRGKLPRVVPCEVALMVEREHCFTHFHPSPSLCTVPLSYFKI